MNKTKKWVVIFLVVAMIATVIPAAIGMFFTNNNKAKTEQTADTVNKEKLDIVDLNKNKDILKPINTFITTLYFDKGSYEDYKSVFLHTEKALDKTSFEDVRKGTKAEDYFKYDGDSAEKLMKHMLAIKKDDKVVIYYLKDINSAEEMKNAKQWTLVKKDKVWLIEN